jgi:methylated-DNA-[protein]-cysteine S-methyltransferase
MHIPHSIYSVRSTAIGRVGIVVSDVVVSGLFFGDVARPEGVRRDAGPVLAEAFAQLEAWLAGRLRVFSLPLAPAATEFGHSIREALLAIPYGSTATYGEVAGFLDRTGAARAVGRACARNPLPIIVPCHRVVRGDGTPGGYVGGTGIKTALLEHEQRNAGLMDL